VLAEAPGRREQRHAATRADILDAARAIVAERGAADLNLKDVAERAGFGNPASLYRYFTSRQEMLVSLAHGSLTALRDHLARVPRDTPAEEYLIGLGLAYLDFARTHPEEIALMFESLRSLSPVDQEVAMPSGIFGIIDDAVRRAVDEDVLPARSEEDIQIMWHGAWALVHGLAMIESLHSGEHCEMLRRSHPVVLRAYIEGLKTGALEAGAAPGSAAVAGGAAEPAGIDGAGDGTAEAGAATAAPAGVDGTADAGAAATEPASAADAGSTELRRRADGRRR